MAKFEIGEMAELVAIESDYDAFVGKARPAGDVEILSGPLVDFSPKCKRNIIYYEIRDCSGIGAMAAEDLLHKKRPPEEARDWFDKNIKTDSPAITEEQAQRLIQAVGQLELTTEREIRELRNA